MTENKDVLPTAGPVSSFHPTGQEGRRQRGPCLLLAHVCHLQHKRVHVPAEPTSQTPQRCLGPGLTAL